MNLFDIIFESGYISKRRLSLPSNKFQELFDHNKLAFILLNEKHIKSDINRKARDEVELLAYYNKTQKYNSTVGCVPVSYYQPSNNLFGRYQARGKLSGQGILREVRHTIYADYYYDLDMVNAHPVILLWLCNHLNIDSKYLEEYVINREKHIADLINLNPNVVKDDVKAIFLSINNGGLASYNNLGVKTEFITSYKNELNSIIGKIVSHFTAFNDIVKEMKKSRKQDFNINGATISHVLQYIENQLLMIIFQYIEERIGDKVYNSILCYDGIMILKNHYKSNWQEELENILLLEYGIAIKLKIKEMDPLDLGKYGFNEDEPYKLNYEVSIAETDVSSYRSILDNENISKELELINSPIYELDVVYYLRSFGEDYINIDDNLHHFNGVYWEGINSEYIYNLMEVVHAKLKEVVENDTSSLSKMGDVVTIEKLKKDLLKKISVLKKQSYSKSVYEYIKSKYNKMENPFDNKIELIGFTNGVYDLDLDCFRPSTKYDYVSMVVPYEYAPSSNNDIDYVRNYVAKIMPIEDEQELLLLLLSTCLSGYVLDRFIVCTGLGSNGKDTLLNYMLKAALGPYFYRGNNTVLTQKQKSDLNVGIANMDCRRAIVFSETSSSSMIDCSLIKELTGGNEINARGLYSSKTSVRLHSTMWMLCNDRPHLDKVDEAIARRLITFKFRSTFKSKEFLDDNKLSDGENYVYIGDETVKADSFLKKYKLPFINLLLPYFQKFKHAGYTIMNIPESIKEHSRKYMEESDLLYNWFSSGYKKTNNKTDVIKLKDVFTALKESEYYMNLTKMEKRNLSYKVLIEYIEKSPLLRMFYKEVASIEKIRYRNVLTNYHPLDPTINDDEL